MPSDKQNTQVISVLAIGPAADLQCFVCLHQEEKPVRTAAYEAVVNVKCCGRTPGPVPVCAQHFAEYGISLGFGLGRKLIAVPEHILDLDGRTQQQREPLPDSIAGLIEMLTGRG